MWRYALGLLAGAVLFVSCNKIDDEDEQTDQSQEEVIVFDYSYGSHPLQNMDVYIPAGDRDTMALMVMVHGGSWVSRDKSDFEMWFNYEVDRKKVAVININYRLDDDSTRPLPMQSDDINSAIEKLREDFDFPARKIGLLGMSSGAHIVTYYAYTYPGAQYVKAVANFVGPVDFTDPVYHTEDHWKWIFTGIEYIFNLSYEGNEAQYADWSPYHHVTADTPPTISFYGGQDTLVPYSNGIRLHERLDSVGVENAYYFYPESEHVFSQEDALDAAIKAEEFLYERLVGIDD